MLNKNTYRDLKSKIIIKECDEKLVEISKDFARFSPHPYLHVDAPYGDKSPFFVRTEVLNALHVAHKRLESLKNGYRLKIFDAYRPLEVQKYMIEYDTKKYSKEIAQKFWSQISDDIALNPPPHATGAAIDLTIIDNNNLELDMGSKIDEFIDASESDFKNISPTCRANRDLLLRVMSEAGFTQLPSEWWHFSYGDQIWAIEHNTYAKYGLI